MAQYLPVQSEYRSTGSVHNSKNSSTYSSSANNSYNGNSSYFGSNSGGYPSDPAPSTNPYKVTESVWQGIMELDTYSYYSFDYESLTNVNGGSPTKTHTPTLITTTNTHTRAQTTYSPPSMLHLTLWIYLTSPWSKVFFG